MTLKMILIACLGIVSTPSLSESSRLIEIRKEKKKIESYRAQGNSNPALDEMYNQLVAEEKKLSKTKKKKKKKKARRKKEKRAFKSSKSKSDENRYKQARADLDQANEDLENVRALMKTGIKSRQVKDLEKDLKRKVRNLESLVESMEKRGHSLPPFPSEGLSANFTATSDYVWRGQTQTNNSFAIQGGLDYEHPIGFSVGSWVSNVSGGSEIDFYASYGFDFTPNFSVSLGYIFYHYPAVGASDTSEYNVNFDLYSFSGSVNYTDGYFGSKSKSWYFSLERVADVRKEFGFKFLMGVGFTNFRYQAKVGSKDYMDYKVGVIKDIGGIDLALTWTDTDRNTFDGVVEADTDDHSFTVSLTKGI